MLRALLLTVAGCLSLGAAKAQSDYLFQHLNSSNSALSYDDCRVIFQDSRGFMWFGTYMGLNRFDGERFTVYNRDDFHGKSDFVHTIAEDNGGNLWIGTDDGLILYDYEADIFKEFDKASNQGTVIRNKVNHIVKASNGTMWISVNGQGLFSYRTDTGEFKNYFVENGNQSLPANIRTFEEDHHGGLWISLYYSGLYHADVSMVELKPVDIADGRMYETDNIEGIVTSSAENGVIYLASVKNGLCKLDTKTGKIRRLLTFPDGVIPTGLYFNGDKNLWIPTTEGLYKYNIASANIDLLKADPNDRFALSNSYVFAVYVDKDDGLWVSTKYGGLNYCSKMQKWFRKCYLFGDIPLSNYVVSGLTDYGEDQILLTTETGRLFLYNSASEKLSAFGPHTMQFAGACFPCLDGDRLWIGSDSGIYSYNVKTEKIELYDVHSKKTTLQDDRVGPVFLSSQDILYVGTTLGLSYYNRENDCFESIDDFDGVNVTSIAEDSFGRVWIGTYTDGIIYYDPESNLILKQFSARENGDYHLPTNKISSVLVDSRDRVWAIGFAYGISVYESGVGHFVTFDEKNTPGMHTDVYFNALEDNNCHIWVSSNKGLLEIDPFTMVMSHYTIDDGLLDDVMKRGVLKKLNGDLYFASQSGFIRFNPADFSYDTTHQFIISGFNLGGKSVKPSDSQSPINENIDLVNEIHLKAGQNSFGFVFSVMNGVASQVRIQCLLDGYEKSWREISSEREAYWYNIPAGKYKLRFRYSDNGTEWFPAHPDVNIEIAEKFWRTPLATLIYLLLVCGVIVLVSFAVHRNAVARMKKRDEEQKIERERGILKEKMEFFADVIHEIKTPLTLIVTPLNSIIESGKISDESLKRDLDTIDSSAKYMNSLVKELLDYMSMEENGYVLNITEFDLVAMLKKSCNNFSGIALQRALSIKFICEKPSIIVSADKKATLKVFNNILDNAIKYAKSIINVSVSEDESYVKICFANDGPSIPEERTSEIFKPFSKFSVENQYAMQSFGIGLPMAKKLVEMQGGTLTLEDSELGPEFIVSIPNILKNDAPEDVPERANDASSLPSILLVEDSRDLSAYLRKELAGEYNIIHTSTAEKALQRLDSYIVDIIIADLGLPGMSGLDFISKIHSSKTLSHIPVLVLSAMSSAEIKTKCMENGASMYIEKPFSMNYLKACIDNLVRASKKSEDEILDSAVALSTLKKLNISATDTDFKKKIDEVIQKNIGDDNFGSKQLEEALFMSRSTLARKTMEHFGMTPGDYLKSKRLSVAAQMLKQKGVRINEVASAVGFRSASYFSKCFKAAYGILPGEYINEKNK